MEEKNALDLLDRNGAVDTIAHQIARIQAATNTLRAAAINIGAQVPKSKLFETGETDLRYWNDANNAYETIENTVSLDADHGLDAIAYAIEKSLTPVLLDGVFDKDTDGDYIVELPVDRTQDGTSTLYKTIELAAGYYPGMRLKAGFKEEGTYDHVLEVASGYSYTCETQSGTITVAGSGYDFFESINYDVESAVFNNSASINDRDTSITITPSTPGWVEGATTISVLGNNLVSLGNRADTNLTNNMVMTDAPTYLKRTAYIHTELLGHGTLKEKNVPYIPIGKMQSTFITLMPGVNSKYHTVQVPSFALLTPSNSGLSDILLSFRVLKGTTLYADGNLIVGTMNDHSGDTSINATLSNGNLTVLLGGYYGSLTYVGAKSYKLNVSVYDIDDITIAPTTETYEDYEAITINSQYSSETVTAGYYSSGIRNVNVKDGSVKITANYNDPDPEKPNDYSPISRTIESGWVDSDDVIVEINATQETFLISAEDFTEGNTHIFANIDEQKNRIGFLTSALVDYSPLYNTLASI